MSERSDEARRAYDEDRIAHWVAEGGLKRLLDEHEILEDYRDAHSAGVVAEEPGWEYAWEAEESVRTTTRPRGPRILFDGVVYPPEAIASFAKGRRIRRRKAGPWVPVKQEGETE